MERYIEVIEPTKIESTDLVYDSRIPSNLFEGGKVDIPLELPFLRNSFKYCIELPLSLIALLTTIKRITLCRLRPERDCNNSVYHRSHLQSEVRWLSSNSKDFLSGNVKLISFYCNFSNTVWLCRLLMHKHFFFFSNITRSPFNILTYPHPPPEWRLLPVCIEMLAT